MCRCGHALQQHSDRAIYPACEGAHSDAGPLLVHVEGTDNEYAFIRWAPKSREHACPCEGFEADGI